MQRVATVVLVVWRPEASRASWWSAIRLPNAGAVATTSKQLSANGSSNAFARTVAGCWVAHSASSSTPGVPRPYWLRRCTADVRQGVHVMEARQGLHQDLDMSCGELVRARRGGVQVNPAASRRRSRSNRQQEQRPLPIGEGPELEETFAATRRSSSRSSTGDR